MAHHHSAGAGCAAAAVWAGCGAMSCAVAHAAVSQGLLLARSLVSDLRVDGQVATQAELLRPRPTSPTTTQILLYLICGCSAIRLRRGRSCPLLRVSGRARPRAGLVGLDQPLRHEQQRLFRPLLHHRLLSHRGRCFTDCDRDLLAGLVQPITYCPQW